MPSEPLLQELVEFLRIPSISSGGGDPADLVRAAEWVCERIEAAGGTAEVVPTPGNPLAVGELRARSDDAPTVLIYGHYDVQSPNPVEAWTTPPFEPTIRDGRIYARGASDDKGNFLPLLHVACQLARSGELPVHVRVVMEGEEEIGGHHVLDWVLEDERGADCAIVFDGAMVDERTPALTLGVRGISQIGVDVRTGPRDLHSGMYGGAALNAVHVLQTMLAEVLPGPDGLLRDELRAGIVPPTADEIGSWAMLPGGERELEVVGGRGLHPDAVHDYYRRNWADASLDLNGIEGGDAAQVRTIIPATARAKLSIRLAPGQRAQDASATIERLMRAAAPEAAEVTFTQYGTGEPAAFDPGTPALVLCREAIERGSGMPLALVRSGGSIGVLSAFADKGIPCALGGFALPSDDIHAPDESYRLESLDLGERTSRELYAALARLPAEARLARR